MLWYRELFLAVTISLASIVLADVLVQPGYEHQYSSYSQSSQHQPVPQTQSPAAQYRAGQLSGQESTRVPGVQSVQTSYPYESYYRSHLVSYPHRPLYHYHYSPRPHFARIGGHGYVRPSVYLGNPQPLTVHDRYKRSRRSRRSDPTSLESNKSEIAAHDNDVATKSPLTDTKNPTAIDSLLPEHEPTDTTNDKRENRQTYDLIWPLLFGIYPEEHKPEPQSPFKIWFDLLKHFKLPNTPSDPESDIGPSYDSRYRDASFLESFMPGGEKEELPPMRNVMEDYWQDYLGMYSNGQLSKFTSQERAAHQGFEKGSMQEIANMDMINAAKPRQDKIALRFSSYSIPKGYHYPETSNAAVTSVPQPQYHFITDVQNQYRNNEESGTDEMVNARHLDGMDSPQNYYSYYSDNYPNYYSTSDNADSYVDLRKRNFNSDDVKSAIRVPDYVLYKNISARNNLTPSMTPPQIQFLHMYNYPQEKKSQAIDYKYYGNTYPSDTPLYDTSSSIYY